MRYGVRKNASVVPPDIHSSIQAEVFECRDFWELDVSIIGPEFWSFIACRYIVNITEFTFLIEINHDTCENNDAVVFQELLASICAELSLSGQRSATPVVSVIYCFFTLSALTTLYFSSITLPPPRQQICRCEVS